MCVILIGKVSREQYELALKQNGDGFSLFTKKQGLVKQPNDKEVDKALDTFGVWHFRIATSGTKDKFNVHPFPVCKGHWYLYHNGVLGDGKGQMSDTHALADLLSDATLTTVRSVLTSLADGNRFALVNSNNPEEYELFGDWKFDAGIILSHKMYDYAKSFYKGGTTSTKESTSYYDDWKSKYGITGLDAHDTKSDLLYDEPVAVPTKKHFKGYHYDTKMHCYVKNNR